MDHTRHQEEQLQQRQQQHQEQQQQCSQGVLDIEGVLGMVFELLEPRLLAKARCTCKLWRQVASDLQVRKASFIRHWQLLGVHGQPRQLQFFETAALASFVRQHVVLRTDTLQMLAVRHGLDVPGLKRVNNLMTEHSLHSRTHLFIPVASREQLQGQLVSFAFCPLSKRQFAVLRGGLHQQQQQGTGAGAEEEHQLHVHSQGQGGAGQSSFKLEALEAKLCQLLGRSLHVDADTAKFYLGEAGGDIKAAMEAFAQDLAWEGTTPGPIRTAPVQRWIEGKAGL
uniref:F-box domain-containing protein n=1 Tax=Tetradesmus obliquus TaxID=3088 RepID=A0A383VBY3_TETOB|eukprot:jgi/Sobl393_1/5614/SZX63068.1